MQFKRPPSYEGRTESEFSDCFKGEGNRYDFNIVAVSGILVLKIIE